MAQIQCIVNFNDGVLVDRHSVIGRPGFRELTEEPAQAIVLPPKGIVKLTSFWKVRRSQGLSLRTRLCLKYQTVSGKTKEIVILKRIAIQG
jgi:hypothetical protein